MELGNIKHLESTYICRFPPEQNLNILSLTYLSGRLGYVKRNKFWIGFTAILVYIVMAFIQYRLSLGSWELVETELNYYYGDAILFAAVVIILVLVAALTFGKAVPSGRVRITRPSSESVDGFGGARARDFSHGPSGHYSTIGLPVSLRQERQRTATFREGAREYDDEDERSE